MHKNFLKGWRYMSKLHKRAPRIIAAVLSLVLLIQAVPAATVVSAADTAGEDAFAAYKQPIRYEMEDFYNTDKWSGTSDGVYVCEPLTSQSENGSLPSGGYEAGIHFGAVGDAITLTLDNIPVSGDYLVYVSGRPVEENSQVYIRKDADSQRASEYIWLRDHYGGDGRSYFSRTLKTEGVVSLSKGTDTVDIVCEKFGKHVLTLPEAPADEYQKIRVDYIEIKLVGGEGVVLTPKELQPIAASNTSTFKKQTNSDADTAWGNITGAFYSLGANAKAGSRIDFPLTGLKPGDYYIKYAYKPRASDSFCVFQTLADGKKIGDPVNQEAGINKPADQRAKTTSNIQTPDPIGIVTVPDSGNVTISLEATEVHGTGALVLLRMWLYPVASDGKIVAGLISDIPDLVTEADADYVYKVKDLYDGLNSGEKNDITDIKRLELALDILNGEALDTAVMNVIKQIAELPGAADLTVADKSAVQSAANSYAALTDVQKEQVTNTAKLEALQSRMADLAAADEVIGKIASLPEPDLISLKDKSGVISAGDSYKALTDAQKAMVTNAGKLNELLIRIDVLSAEELIKALPDPDGITKSDRKAAAAAKDAFEALGENQDLISDELQQKLHTVLIRLGLVQSLYGDINLDGLVDVSDVLTLRNAVRSGTPSDAELKNGDMDESGKLDEKDVSLLLRLLSIKEGDINSDAKVTANDVIALSDAVLNRQPDDRALAVGDLDSSGKLDIHDLMAVREIALNDETAGEYSANAAGMTTYTAAVHDPTDEVHIQVMGQDRVKAKGVGTLSYGLYYPGDIVSVTADHAYFWVQLNEKLGETLVYSPSGNFSFQIPFDDAGADATGFEPGVFRDATNIIKARIATAEEISAYQNLAQNVYDFRYLNEKTDYDGSSADLVNESKSIAQNEVRAYPHAYANRVWKNDAVNGARTAIDGHTEAGAAGEYPNQAWDGGRYDDAEFILYFGREVTVSQLNLMLRFDKSGDKAHDTYWESVTVQLSDGSEKAFTLTGKTGKQELKFDKIKTSYVRLKGLKRRADSSTDMWAALTEIEVLGYNTDTENPAAVKSGPTPFGVGNTSKVVTNQYKAADLAATLKKIQQTYEKDNLYIYNKVASNCWFEAVYHTGLLEAYMTTGDADYYLSSNQFAESYGYMVLGTENTAHADWFAVGQNFLTLYELSPYSQNKLTDTFVNTDWLADRAVRENDPVPLDFWWCDAFYMGGLIFTKATNLTGDTKYAEAEHAAYLHWRDKLYNSKYQLWARDDRFVAEVRPDDRFPANEKMTAPTGVPIFWARGNAWIMGYLAQQLTNIKDKDSEIYKTLAADFKELAAGVKAVQRADGTWNTSMADPDYFAGPESTGTAGFLYAFSVGMSLGLLDRNEYMPATVKAYEALTGLCQISDGKIGYMQQPGDRPSEYVSEEFTRKRTETYGMGLFYMGVSAFMRLCSDYEAPILEVPMDNQLMQLSRYAKDPGAYTGNITATASSQESANTAKKAFDGFVAGGDGGRWTASTRGFDNTWIKADLGKPVALEKINVHMMLSRDYQYKLEVSTDNVNWVTVSDRTDNKFPMIYQQNKFEPIYARYVRLTVTGTGGTYTGNITSISEIMLYEYTGDGVIRNP